MSMLSEQLGFMSVHEAAEAIGISGAYVRQLLLKGEITGQKLGERTWAIPAAEVDRFRNRPVPKTGRPRGR